MGLSWQEYWSELLFPPAGDLPNPETESMSSVSLTLADGSFTSGSLAKSLKTAEGGLKRCLKLCSAYPAGGSKGKRMATSKPGVVAAVG